MGAGSEAGWRGPGFWIQWIGWCSTHEKKETHIVYENTPSFLSDSLISGMHIYIYVCIKYSYNIHIYIYICIQLYTYVYDSESWLKLFKIHWKPCSSRKLAEPWTAGLGRRSLGLEMAKSCHVTVWYIHYIYKPCIHTINETYHYISIYIYICVMSYHIISYRIVLYHIAWYYIILHYFELYCIILYCIYIVLYSIILYYIGLSYIVLYMYIYIYSKKLNCIIYIL